MINLYRMVFNNIAFEVLDRYKNNKMNKDQAMTKLNQLVDYVRHSEIENNRRDRKDNGKRS